jgi:hypothetical protein
MFKINDRVSNVHGFLGTVLKVFPDEGIVLVRFDEEKRGKIVGRDWHCHAETLTLVV